MPKPLTNATIRRRVSNFLTAKRADYGYSQERFASQLGISRGYLSDLERQNKDLSVATFVSISARLNTTPDQILGLA